MPIRKIKSTIKELEGKVITCARCSVLKKSLGTAYAEPKLFIFNTLR